MTGLLNGECHTALNWDKVNKINSSKIENDFIVGTDEEDFTSENSLRLLGDGIGTMLTIHR